MKLTHTLFVIRTVNSFGWSATMPFFAVYLEVVRGVGLGAIGVAYLVSGVFSLLGQLLGGWLTDLYGSKKVMFSAYTSSIVFSSIMVYALSARLSVLPTLALYVCFSLFRALSNPATAALIASQRKREVVSFGFSLQTMGGNIGFALGPAVGGFLTQLLGYPTLFTMSALTATAALALAASLIHFEEHRDPPPKIKETKVTLAPVETRFLALLGLVVALYFVDSYMYTPLSLYAAGFAHLTNREIGLFFTLNGLLIVALQLPIMKLLEAHSQTSRAPAYSTLLMAAAYYIIAHTYSFAAFFAAVGVATVGEILITVPTQIIVATMSGPNNRGTYQGYYSASSSIGRSLASFVAPLSFEDLQPPNQAWEAVSAFSLAVGVAAAALLRRTPKANPQPGGAHPPTTYVAPPLRAMRHLAKQPHPLGSLRSQTHGCPAKFKLKMGPSALWETTFRLGYMMCIWTSTSSSTVGAKRLSSPRRATWLSTVKE